jgi:ADP-ribose pyrophosphatase/8-oxo-dGTP diphosphatase
MIICGINKSMKKKVASAGLGVILEENGKVLLGKRHFDPDKADSEFRSAGVWSLPGGKLDWGETLEEGAVREVKEEAGITIRDPKVISVHNHMNEYAHFVTVGMIVKKWRGKPKVMEPDEITEWKWFSLDKLPKERYFPSFEVIENYKKGKFYIKRN